ncbi:MAG: PHP domain-containing protein [Clostridia bacterium]
MNDFYLKHLEKLNDHNSESRLKSLEVLMEGIHRHDISRPATTGRDVNNHIHTTYSFSPYSPAKSIWMAYVSGLTTAGIMDHDTVAGAEEFIRAGEIVGMATTTGLELRVDAKGTLLEGKKSNNPDQKSVMYMAMHGIPHTKLDDVQEFIRPYAEKRNLRNMEMVRKLNGILFNYDISLDYEEDVVPLSLWTKGGSVTERHISYALSLKLIARFGQGEKLVDFYKHTMGIPLNAKTEGLLLNGENPVYAYDLLGAIKSDMVEMFYLPATAECPGVFEAVALASDIGAIPAYPYLGDVGDSATGDKKPQKFEDDYLPDLFPEIRRMGFKAVAYMPSRNTKKQLERLKDLCVRYSFMEISGEDINSPRQKFVCDAMRDPMFSNLFDSTWALIAHEKKATACIHDGLFSEVTVRQYPDLDERIRKYSRMGQEYGGSHEL